jgi:predicted nucleic acid-binding protein
MLSRWRAKAKVGGALVCCAVVLPSLGVGAARAASPRTPETRLLDIWLDLRLLDVFYPDTTAETFAANLTAIAKQLGQAPTPIRFGETAQDARRFRVGAVMIKQHPPPDTWILFTRSRSHVWKLVDDAHGDLTLARVPSGARP